MENIKHQLQVLRLAELGYIPGQRRIFVERAVQTYCRAKIYGRARRSYWGVGRAVSADLALLARATVSHLPSHLIP